MEIKDLWKVKDLRAALDRLDPEAPLAASVGWAADTATSDGDNCLWLDDADGTVTIRGFMSNCNTDLDFEED